MPINGAEGFHRHKIIHERAGAIIDCDPPHMAVVGVHHPVNEAHTHPLRDKARLRGDSCAQKMLGGLRLGVMAFFGVLKKCVQRLFIVAGGEILKCTDANMA